MAKIEKLIIVVEQLYAAACDDFQRGVWVRWSFIIRKVAKDLKKRNRKTIKKFLILKTHSLVTDTRLIRSECFWIYPRLPFSTDVSDSSESPSSPVGWANDESQWSNWTYGYFENIPNNSTIRESKSNAIGTYCGRVERFSDRRLFPFPRLCQYDIGDSPIAPLNFNALQRSVSKTRPVLS